MEDRADLVAASLAAMQDQADPTAAAAVTFDAAVPTAVAVDPETGCRLSHVSRDRAYLLV
jgi:hypothetical protein